MKCKLNPKMWGQSPKVIVLLVLIVGLALIIRDASDEFRPLAYDVNAPAIEKFEDIKELIPPQSSFFIAVDIPRVLGDEALRSELALLVEGRDSVSADMVDNLLTNPNAIGMLMLVGSIWSGGGGPHLAVIAQGKFDEKTLLPAVRRILAGEHAGIIADEECGRTFFLEANVNEPFGFVVLDRRHLAVGSAESLKAFFCKHAFQDSTSVHEGLNQWAVSFSGSVVFGRIAMNPRLQILLPKGLVVPWGIDFVSDEGLLLKARISFDGLDQARDFRMFLEGMRSLLMIEEEQNTPLVSVLNGFAITSEGTDVVITTNAKRLLQLWAR